VRGGSHRTLQPLDLESDVCTIPSRALQSERVLTFGLGTQAKADTVETQSPAARWNKFSNVNAGQTVTIKVGKGIVSARPYRPPSQSAR
jgi:hypothetical protein